MSNGCSAWPAAFFLLLSIPALAAAQASTESIERTGEIQTNSDFQLEQIIVTGTTLRTRATDLSAHLEVITSTDIEQRGKRSAIDLMRQVSGLRVLQQGGPGGISALYLRGGEPNFLTVMIDGVEQNDPSNSNGGSFEFAGLPEAGIEKIELLAGPQSATYGSGSLSGIINVITESGAGGNKQSLNVDLGGDGYHSVSASLYGGLLSQTTYGLQLGIDDSGTGSVGSELQRRYANLKLESYLFGAQAQLTARFTDIERQTIPEDSGGPLFAASLDTDQDELQDFSLGATLEWQHSDALRSELRLSSFQREQTFFSPGIVPFDSSPPRGDQIDYRRLQGRWLAEWQAAPNVQLGAGVDVRDEDGSDDGFVNFFSSILLDSSFELQRRTYGQFLELRLKPVRSLVVNIGLRNDKTESSADHLTGRLGLSMNWPEQGLAVYINHGTAFKQASFFALGNALVGNANLLPEESRASEIGLKQRFGDSVTFGLSYYRNRFDRLVDLDEATFQNVNSGRINTSGFDANLSYKPADSMSLRAFVSYLDIDTPNSQQRLRGRPEWFAGLSLFANINEVWSAALDYSWSGETIQAAVPLQTTQNPAGDIELDSYHRVDLAVHWQAARNWRLRLALDNLLDANYQEAYGFPAPGLQARIGARFTF